MLRLLGNCFISLMYSSLHALMHRTCPYLRVLHGLVSVLLWLLKNTDIYILKRLLSFKGCSIIMFKLELNVKLKYLLLSCLLHSILQESICLLLLSCVYLMVQLCSVKTSTVLDLILTRCLPHIWTNGWAFLTPKLFPLLSLCRHNSRHQ